MERGKQMKTAKLVIGIISMVLSVFVLFQSCAAGLVNSLTGSGASSGSAGLLVAACLVIAGIIGVATRNQLKQGGTLTAAGFYLAAALIGATLAGNYRDLTIWAYLAWAFGAVFLVAGLVSPPDRGVVLKWWQQSGLITLVLIVLPPVGIILLWLSGRFKMAPKIVTTVIVALGFVMMLGNIGGSFSSSGVAASGTAGPVASDNGASTTAPAETARVYGLGETWTVDGQFALHFTAVTATAERNAYADQNPAEVVILTYDYENLGVTKSIVDLYVSSSSFKVIDAAGVMADSYPALTVGNPQETPIGAKCVGAQTAYGLVNSSGEITVNVEVIGNNYKTHEATFKLPVS